MTVICWDGATLAADKRANYGGMICTITKIHRVSGLLVGGEGDFCHVLALVEWVREGRQIEKYPKHQEDKDDTTAFLVVELDGTISLYERTPFPIRYEQQHFAIGSGREYACAALYLGCNAQHAVGVAVALDSGCGNGIDTLTLEA